MKKTSANPRFQFTAKLHQDFTHRRILEEKAVQTFKEGLKPLLTAKKLGALLMQFPWSFRLTEENREFVIRLRRAFHEYPLVAEMRHSSWMAEEAVGTFIDYRIGFCNIDQPEYTRAMPPTALLTTGIGYVRMHGRNPKNSLGGFHASSPIERQRQHDYLYTAAELDEWAKRIEHVNRFAETTFVIFNNDAAGKSVVNSLEMKAKLTGVHPVAPRELRRKFPMELAEFTGQSQQQWLFSAA
jgi:uncharacterized protein YecE (DUF72 family)